MVVQALYQALDDLVDQTTTLRDEFYESGDLSQLSKDTEQLGSRGYSVSSAVDDVIKALGEISGAR